MRNPSRKRIRLVSYLTSKVIPLNVRDMKSSEKSEIYDTRAILRDGTAQAKSKER